MYTLRSDRGGVELNEGNGLLSIQQINEIESMCDACKRRVEVLEKLSQVCVRDGDGTVERR